MSATPYKPGNPHEVGRTGDVRGLQTGSGTVTSPADSFYQSKLIQPDWRIVTLDGSQGLNPVADDWYGPWDVQSIKVVNPYLFPIYVIGSGDPVNGGGLPFPPQLALRVPISGQNGSLVIGANPTDLGDNQAQIHIFRYPLPD